MKCFDISCLKAALTRTVHQPSPTPAKKLHAEFRFGFSTDRTLISKYTLDHWETVILLFSPGKMHLTVVQECFDIRNEFPFLKMSLCSSSWYTDTSFSSLFMKFSQVLHFTFLDDPPKAVMPVASTPFSTEHLPSSQLSSNTLKYNTSANCQPFQ